MGGCWSLFLRGAAFGAASFQLERVIAVSKDTLKPKSSADPKQSGIDWTRFDAITDEEIEASIRNDPDVAPEADEEWFRTATLVMPRPKEQISIRLDHDVLEHFRRYPRYQTLINAILRAAMEYEKKAG